MAKRIWLARSGQNILCCSGRPNTCNNLSFLRSRDQNIHDEALRQATDEINRIFDDLRGQAPDDTHLALLDTGLGLLLVWAEGSERPPDLAPFVRYESPEEVKRETLGLVEPAAA